MVTAEELTVAIKSEGVGETREDIEGVERSMEDTAEATSDSAEELEGFSENLAGVASAAVAGLAIATAGILSQVPVIGETFAALGAIVDAFAFRLDGVLRPVLSGFNQLLFEFANAVFNAEGPVGTLADAVSVLVPLLGIGSALALGVAKIVAVLNALGVTAITVSTVTAKLSGALAVLSGVASTVGGAITTVLAGLKTVGVILGSAIAGISATTAALGILAAAVIGFAAAYITNFKGVRDTTNQIIGNIVDSFVGLASTLIDWAAATASKAFNWGVNIVTAIIEGIESFAQNVADALIGVINDVIRSINVVLDTLPDEITSRVGVEQFATISQQSVSADTPSQSGRARGSINRGGRNQRVTLDGRNLTESTGRYRSDPSRRRGL